MADTGLDEFFLLQLFMKGILAENLELPSQFTEAICLLANAGSHIVIPDRLLTRLGPAINSDTTLLLYGPAGNGKTMIGKIFKAVIYIAHCFVAEGQIVKVLDPTVHEPIPSAGGDNVVRDLRRERFDKRYMACSRPLIITGGELSIEMLDLKFNSLTKFYEAPLHVKALNGTFLIDDFGCQRASPEDILNRWIVPLNSRIDFMTFDTGKAIETPFDELVIFSTNLHPNDLMDPAFQRRITYKLETVKPSGRTVPSGLRWYGEIERHESD